MSGNISLEEIALRLRRDVHELPPAYVPGKTVLRDQVMILLGCSATEAEGIVDQLEADELIRFDRNRTRLGRLLPRWQIGAAAGN